MQIIDTPIAHWAFDETSGTIANDSADSHNGTVGGNPVWSSDGKVNGCLDLDGNGDYVNFGNFNSFNFAASNFTISCWFKSEGTHDIGSGGGTGHGMLVSKYSINGRQWFLQQEDDGKISFATFYADTGTSADNCPSTGSYQGIWTHVTAVRDGNTKYLYINGLLDNTGICSGIVSGVSTNVLTGALSSGSLYYQTFNGKVDDIRIYDYALGASEVAELYQIPEPATICLFGLAGLMFRNKK